MRENYNLFQNPPTAYENNFSANEEHKIDVSSVKKQGRNDALFGLRISEKIEFYRRLAKATKEKDKEALAALLLLHWLDGDGTSIVIPNHRVKNNGKVKEQLKVYRQIFLSRRQTNWTTRANKIAGIIPRLENGEWDGNSELTLKYEGGSFSIVPRLEFLSIKSKIFFGKSLTSAEMLDLDLFTSLHETSIESRVVIVGQLIEAGKTMVRFKKWENHIKDNYNWDNERAFGSFKHLTVFNPDYNNKFDIPNPVKPESEVVTIYHIHQKEIEKKSLASPFDFVSEIWTSDDQLSNSETITFNPPKK